MAYSYNRIPQAISKAILYKSGYSYGTVLDTNTTYYLSSTDKLLIQFSFQGLTQELFYLSVARLNFTSMDTSSYGYYSIVKALTGNFTTSNSYASLTSIEGATLINYSQMPCKNETITLYDEGFKSSYGIELTGFSGSFNANSLTLEYETQDTTVTASGNNVDTENITASSVVTLATEYTIAALQNGNVIKSYTGTKVFNDDIVPTLTLNSTDTTFTSLNPLTFMIKANGKNYPTNKRSTAHAYIYNEASVIQSLTCNNPTISVLEPNNVNQDKDTNINVSWVSTLQTNFNLNANGKVFTGTTAQGLVIPSGTFNRLETVNIVLTVYRNVYGSSLTASKSASFLLVGKPNTPILEQKQFYSEATPTFNWTCADSYVQYHVEVLQGSTVVFNSGDVVSSATSCLCTTTLANNTTYTVKVKVRTQFGYWSDFATNTFTTNFVVANKPSVNVYASGNSVIINSNTVYTEAFSNCELYRKTDLTEWVRIAYDLDNNFTYTDNFVGNETYYYKVTSVSTTGGKNDSDVLSASITINNFNFANIEDVNNGVELVGNPSISITQNRQVSTNLYSGCYAPVVETGIQNYKSGSASFTVRKATYDKLMKVINGSKVLIYRDRRGEKIYCAITSNMSKKYDVGDVYNISFSFVEVPFLEADMYKGSGNLSVVFFDGKYMFDGAISFSGEV